MSKYRDQATEKIMSLTACAGRGFQPRPAAVAGGVANPTRELMIVPDGFLMQPNAIKLRIND
jgi:hypothetical protein